MKQTITFNSYLTKILIIAGLYLILPMLFSFGSNLSTAGSYVATVLCFLILVTISVFLLLGKKYVRFYVIAFLVQVIIGLIHYLLLVNPNYFNTSGNPLESFWSEYHAVFSSIEKLIENRNNNSLFYFDEGDWSTTHYEIWQIITIPFTFLGHKWLNYSPFNVFSSLLTSINMVVVYNKHNPPIKSIKETPHRWVLMATAYFPLFLLNDTLWRDAFGIALISIGLVLLTLSDNSNKKYLSLIVLVYFSFLLRNVYVFVAGFVFLYMELKNSRRALSIIVIPIAIASLYVISVFFQSKTSDEYVGLYVSQMSFWALPIKIIFGLIGPFPWSQFMMTFSGRIENAYLLDAFIMGIFQVGYLLAIIGEWKRLSFNKLDYCALMGFGMMFSGFVSNALHISYIAVGVLLTLPWFYSQIRNGIKKYMRLSFIILLFLNILVLVFGNLGIANLWR